MVTKAQWGNGGKQAPLPCQGWQRGARAGVGDSAVTSAPTSHRCHVQRRAGDRAGGGGVPPRHCHRHGHRGCR